mmetsp:Transcript_46751/g.98204  ORF Transcript_46751/g.98204 Transcript_46751/m.98204 type:complete len:199 (-) Transcript_46751:376-972(-)
MSCADIMYRQHDFPFVDATTSVPEDLPALQYANKHSRKRLRFHPAVAVRPINFNMTSEEKSMSYYTAHELNAFKQEAKKTLDLYLATSDSSVGLEFNVDLRGLERYLCPLRGQNQMLARKAVLKCQQILKANHKMSMEDKLHPLARSSSKLSLWSKTVALGMARLDSTRALEENYSIPIPDLVSIAPFPLVTKQEKNE